MTPKRGDEAAVSFSRARGLAPVRETTSSPPTHGAWRQRSCAGGGGPPVRFASARAHARNRNGSEEKERVDSLQIRCNPEVNDGSPANVDAQALNRTP